MSDDIPLMPKATAVWLVDNTTLTFRQIADFVGMHELEISGIADGEVAVGIKGFDPVQNSQLTEADIKKCEADAEARLTLLKRQIAPEPKRKAPRYTPLSKRQDRPAAIAWLVRYHPELADSQISKLVGTTKPTIQSIRTRSHWNYSSIQPVDPVALGLCNQGDLDAAVRKAAAKKAAELGPDAAAAPDPRESLMPTDEALSQPLPSNVSGFETFALDDQADAGPIDDLAAANFDPESLFNLPKRKKGEDEDEAEAEAEEKG